MGSAKDGVAVVPPSTAAEKRAAALATEAMNKDFLAMAYANAEKKLRRAIQMCLKQNCSAPFRARLHRDVGVLYITGMSRVEDGKDEFATALSADATVAIPAELITDEVEGAFLDVKSALLAETQGGGAVEPEPIALTSVASAPDKDAELQAAIDAWKAVQQWISLAIEQDFMIHSSTQNVCNQNSSYKCWDSSNQPQDYSGRKVTAGNTINSTAFTAASLRLLFGYERLLSKHYSVGGKLGLILGGKAPYDKARDPGIAWYHVEARFTVYPGVAPFDPTKIVRPYGYVAAGIAEVDGKVSVDAYAENEPYRRMLAWKRGGKGMLGLGLGAVFPIFKIHGPFAEMRLIQTLGTPAMVVGLQAGYALAF